MPYYDYRCPSCNEVVELRRKSSERNKDVYCQCDTKMSRVINVPPVNFDGDLDYYGGRYGRGGYYHNSPAPEKDDKTGTEA